MSINIFFTSARTIGQKRHGPLGLYIDEYAALLLQQGYTQRSACQMINVVADFSHWLYSKYLTVEDVNVDQIARYLKYCRRTKRVCRGMPAALRKMLKLLINNELVCPEQIDSYMTPSDQVLQNYTQYLSQACGYSTATVRTYRMVISEFMASRFGSGAIDFSALSGAEITQFVQHHAYSYSCSRASLMIKALRSFLRYLRCQGDIILDLANCVPSVANWSLTDLPRYLQPGEVQRVLAHCNRGTITGRRDYAILLLLAKLGLRAGEVICLQLDDIDWAQSHFTIRGKNGRWTRLPLLTDVGEAIAYYLRNGRPNCTDRRVFIREHAPLNGFKSSSGVSALVARAFLRAGIDSPQGKAHRFRHTLATEMLHHGASLQDIGEVLRHRHMDTTLIYAKVDLSALQNLTVPWLGGEL